MSSECDKCGEHILDCQCIDPPEGSDEDIELQQWLNAPMGRSIESQKCSCFHALDGYETYKIDQNTIGVRPFWFKCSENLPENDYSKRILAFGIPLCGTCGDSLRIEFCIFFKNIFTFGEYDCSFEATHWMPLPKPPLV